MNNELDRASKLPRAKEAQGLLTRMDSQFTVATPQTHSTSLGKKFDNRKCYASTENCFSGC